MKTENQENNQKEVFKTPYHYASEDDELMNIETAIYPNGNVSKRITLSTGQKAVVRELSGGDMMEIDDLLAGENNAVERQKKYLKWIYHLAVKIDGKQIPMEDFGTLKGKDFNRIKITAQTLNF